MLLASTAIASAPLMGETKRGFDTTPEIGVLHLTSAAVSLIASHYSGASYKRQKIVGRAATGSLQPENMPVSINRTIIL